MSTDLRSKLLQRWLKALATAAVMTAASFASAAGTWLQVNATGHTAPIMRIAVDAARDLVVTASDDKTARLWTLSDERLIAVLRPPVGPARIGRLFGAAVHPTRDLVAVAGSGSVTTPPGPSIWFFSASNGQFVRRFHARGDHVRRLTFSADGRLVAACYADPGAIRVFDAESGNLVYEDRFGGDCLALAARGMDIVAGTRDGVLALYRVSGANVTPLRRIAADGDVLAVDLSPDGALVAAGYFTVGAGSAVFDVASGRRLHSLRTRDDVPNPRATDTISTTQAIRFGADGLNVYTAGVANLADGRVEGRLYRFDASNGSLQSSQRVADDTVTDIAIVSAKSRIGAALTNRAEAEEAVAWSSFAGTWGLANAAGNRAIGRAGIDFLVRRAAGELHLSADALTVRWVRGVGRVPVSFQLPDRRVGSTERADLIRPQTRRGLFAAASNFENHLFPEINGQRVSLATGEISRALTFLGDTADVALATSEGLRRVDRDRRVIWEVRTATEVRAVNASADGALLVTLLSDGTLRWWRASDGALLLSALVLADGWVIWMPTGHFDASHGVESRIGWLVDRPDSAVPDFFSVGRFRAQFHRPDIIDRVLRLRDVQLAVAEADALRFGASPHVASSLSNSPTLPSAVDQIQPWNSLALPPVIAPVRTLRLVPDGQPVRVQFSLRSERPIQDLQIEARLDGQLVEPISLSLPPSLDGRTTGEIAIGQSSTARLLQLVARTGDAASEPLRYVIDRQGAAPLEPTGQGGRLYIVAVGISQYRDETIKLRLPAKDAVDFVGLMKTQRGRLYEDVEAKVLTDAEATRSNIEEAMRWLHSQVTERDVGIVFLAGHGLEHPVTGSYHIVPWEFDKSRPEQTLVSGAVISRPLAMLRGRAFLILDTCAAGGAEQLFSGAVAETARFTNTVSAPENAVTVFASSTAKQLSWERLAWGNGAFTKILLDGLNGSARLQSESLVTTRSLGPFVKQGVSKLTEGRQTPVIVIPEGIPERIMSKGIP